MPRPMEKKLFSTAAKRGYSRRRTNAYVYGTLAKLKGKRRS